MSSVFEEARGRLVDALRWNAAALTRSPDVVQLYSDRGRLFVSLGLIERARATYSQALQQAGPDAERGLLWLDFVTLFGRGDLATLRQRIAAARSQVKDDPADLFDLAYGDLLLEDWHGARALVDQALASPRLEPSLLEDPWLAGTGYSYLLIVAVADQKTGDYAGARFRLGQLDALLQRLTAAGTQLQGIEELRAQSAALRGDADAAVTALRRAIDLGWRNEWLAEHEPYLASVRDRADFRALLAQVRADAAADIKMLDADAPVVGAMKLN